MLTHRILSAACECMSSCRAFPPSQLKGMSGGCGQLNASKFEARRHLKYKPFHFLYAYRILGSSYFVTLAHVPRGRPPSDGVKRLTLVPRENMGQEEKERKMQRKRERALESLSVLTWHSRFRSRNALSSSAGTIHDAEAARARMLDPYSHMARDRESHRDTYSNFVVPGACAFERVLVHA